MGGEKKSVSIVFVLLCCLVVLLSFCNQPVLSDDNSTVVSVSPQTLTIAPDESFTLSLYCTPHQPIKSYELSLSFDSSLLQVDSVSEGDMFNGYSTFFNAGTIDNSVGTIDQIYGLIIGSGNVSSSGTLVDISFTAQNLVGNADIVPFDVGITNETQYISVSIVNGSIHIENICPSIENQSCVFSDPVDTDVSFGWCNISCDVIDDSLDTVNLVVTKPDNTVTNSSFTQGSNDLFYLNMSGFDPGSYSYYIFVKDVYGNQVLTNQSSFQIPPNWDVDRSGSVSLLDLIKISNLYGMTGDLGWIREDVDNDGSIQLSDIIMVSNHYEESW